MSRSKLLQIFIWLLALCLWGGGPGGSTAVSVQAQDSPATVLQLVNQVRAAYGLAGYVYNGALATAAQEQATWMAVSGEYAHTHGNSTPQSRATAAGYVGYVTENIVGGTDLSAQQGVTWWQNSAVHFNTMISTRYQEAGVGVASGQGQNFYVLVVGNPSDSPPPVNAANAVTDAPPAYVAPIALAAPREDGAIVHRVLPGHTLWAIAARYGVPLETLLLYNSLGEDAVLTEGQELLIQLAEGQEPPPTSTPPATHIVRQGETPWTIAARYRLTIDEFLWLNGLMETDLLHPGQEVMIHLLPGQAPPPTPTPQLTHRVARGDTLLDIAYAYGLTLPQLLEWNGLTADALIIEGVELFIRATETPTPLPTATETGTAVPMTASSTPTGTAVPSATPTLFATPTPTPTPTPADTPMGNAMMIGSLVFGIGLTALAIAGVVALRREGEVGG